MPTMRRFVTIAAVALVTALVALGWQHPEYALAHGYVDQANDLTNGGAAQVQFAEPVGQEFTPSKSVLVGVDVRLVDFNNTGNATMTARVRSGTIGGPVVAEATRILPQNLLGAAEWVRFDFPSPVIVTPGNLYVLELDSNNASHGWSRSATNAYPGGASIFQGVAGSIDWSFHTYVTNPAGDVDCNGQVTAVDALKILRQVAGLSVTQTEPCPDIGQFP
ncbi:MAG TPA: hypothetical protein VFP63_02795 [Dehalococcoidia bacterium]|nr:hypothetical protein [Dehalococcoidia bacterium]